MLEVHTCQLTATIQAYETTFETTCKTSCAVTSRLLTRGNSSVKISFFVASLEHKDVSSCEV